MEVFPLILVILGVIAGVVALFVEPYGVRAAAAGVILLGAGILLQFA
jgi:hypothetical protein